MTSQVGGAEALPRGRDTVRVWDPLVKIVRWAAVLGIALNYFVLASRKAPHRYVGYGVAAALAVRVVWGSIGSAHARFSDFVTSPRAMLSHLAAVVTQWDRRYVGHNPAGGAMIPSAHDPDRTHVPHWLDAGARRILGAWDGSRSCTRLASISFLRWPRSMCSQP